MGKSPLANTRRLPLHTGAIGFDLPYKTPRVIDAYSQACTYRLARFLGSAATEEPDIDGVRSSDGSPDDQFPELGGDAEGER
jgi:hypothetical protein